jgi:polysaccharide pyruvyl transferase WcaK-like protein
VGTGRTIAVWGHYHGGNLGDELVVSTVVEAIRRRDPDATIVGISGSPADTRVRHGIDAYPIIPDLGEAKAPAETPSAETPASATDQKPPGHIRKAGRRVPGLKRVYGVAREPLFLKRSYDWLQDVDLVVVAGSGPLLDTWQGPWGHPYSIFRWALLTRLAKVPMAYLSVGAGPIDGGLSRFFIRRALGWSSYLTVRDAHSAVVLSAIGVKGPPPVKPDMGFGLPDHYLDRPPRSNDHGTGELVVGLNLMAHGDPRYWHKGDPDKYAAYVDKMAAFTAWLLESGHRVTLFSSQIPRDRLVEEDVLEALGRISTVDRERLESAFARIEGVSDLVSVIAGCDVVISARYHSVLLPLLLDVPVIGLSYHPKTNALFDLVGRSGECLDIDRVDSTALENAFQATTEPLSPEAHLAFRRRVEELRRAVEDQFDACFGVTPVDATRSSVQMLADHER